MASGTLYVVATPIGHLGDLSDRVREVLAGVHLIAAEDTRRTRTLLASLGIGTRMCSYHAHSPESRTAMLLETLQNGHDVALVTDAGTPVLSDPGIALVTRAHAARVPVSPIPGPSAITALLSVAGMPADRFVFLGFLPRRGTERRRLLDRVAQEQWTTVLFEAPTRLVPLLEAIREQGDGDRLVAVGRELTKVHEEVRVATVTELMVHYSEQPPRGEVTLAIAGTKALVEADQDPRVDERIAHLLQSGLPKAAIARQIADEFGLPRNAAYARVQAYR